MILALCGARWPAYPTEIKSLRTCVKPLNKSFAWSLFSRGSRKTLAGSRGRKSGHCHSTSAPPVRSVRHAVKGTCVDACGKRVLGEVWGCTTLGCGRLSVPAPHWWEARLLTHHFHSLALWTLPPLANCTPDFLYVYVGYSCFVSLKGHDPKKVNTTICFNFSQEGKTKTFKIQITLCIIFPFKSQLSRIIL